MLNLQTAAVAITIGKVALAATRRDGSGLTEDEFAERVGRAVLVALATPPPYCNGQCGICSCISSPPTATATPTHAL